MALPCRALFRSFPTLISRSFHASPAMQDEEFKKMIFNLEGFYKFGLLKDDFLLDNNADVAEAIRRLPEEMQMQRKYRAIRASQAEINNSLLPKDQWSKFEDDHNYLQPYLQEVIKEREEREEWEAKK